MIDGAWVDKAGEDIKGVAVCASPAKTACTANAWEIDIPNVCAVCVKKSNAAVSILQITCDEYVADEGDRL